MPRPKKSNRNDGRYEIQRVIGYDINGKAVKKSFYGKSKDDALSKFEDYKRGINKAEEEKKALLFSEWVDRWLEVYKRPDVKDATFDSTYYRPCKNHILPYFEGKMIQEITQLEVKKYLNTLTDKSQSLIDKITICLRGIFETAIDNDLIAKNPCRNITCKSKKESARKRTYDEESVKLLCSSDHEYAILAHILLRMGLRCSELCGLRWEDIDLENETLYVRQAITSVHNKVYVDKPKTKNSIRRLKIPADLLERLKRERSTGLVAKSQGKPLVPNKVAERRLKPFYKSLNVPENQQLTPHELRHTCGTLLYEKTKDIYHVSRFLGHSDIGITTKIYVHSEMQEDKIHIKKAE